MSYYSLDDVNLHCDWLWHFNSTIPKRITSTLKFSRRMFLLTEMIVHTGHCMTVHRQCYEDTLTMMYCVKHTMMHTVVQWQSV